jgi:hypothetical protein
MVCAGGDPITAGAGCFNPHGIMDRENGYRKTDI